MGSTSSFCQVQKSLDCVNFSFLVTCLNAALRRHGTSPGPASLHFPPTASKGPRESSLAPLLAVRSACLHSRLDPFFCKPSASRPVRGSWACISLCAAGAVTGQLLSSFRAGQCQQGAEYQADPHCGARIQDLSIQNAAQQRSQRRLRHSQHGSLYRLRAGKTFRIQQKRKHAADHAYCSVFVF